MAYDQHLFIVEDRFEDEALAMERVRGHEHVDLVSEERAHPAELEALFDIHVDQRPSLEVRRNNLE